MAGAQISTSLTIVNSLLGFQAISLTEFATSAQSLIAAGSKVEVGGSFFTFAGNDTPQASTWTAITTGSTAYITLTPSGGAGSQILTSMYSDTAPVFSTSKQGWYLTAASIIRYIGGVTKGSATKYDDAFILYGEQEATARNLTVDNDLVVRRSLVAKKYTELANYNDNNSANAVTFNNLFNDVPDSIRFRMAGFMTELGTGRMAPIQWATKTNATTMYLYSTVLRTTAGSVLITSQTETAIIDGDGKTYSWRVVW